VKDGEGKDVCFDGEKLQEKLFDLGLPIGWAGVDAAAIDWSKPKLVIQLASLPFAAIKERPNIVLGWLITALAASLGAQFWFDTLGKLLKMRSAGPTPDEKKQGKDKP
jgi:hypothetical protein